MTEPGFPLPYALQPLRTFVREGDLWRLLDQLVELARGTFELRLQVDAIGDSHIVLRFWVSGREGGVTLDHSLLAEEALQGLTTLMQSLNATVHAAGYDARFVIDRLSGNPDRRFDYVVCLLWGSRLEAVVQRSWEAEACIVDVPSGTTSVEVLHPPRLPRWWEIVPDVRVFGGRSTLPEMLAALAEELSAHAGLSGVRCEPVESRSEYFQGPGQIALRMIVEAGRGSIEHTLRLRASPELDIQPILDELNALLEAGGSDLRLERLRSLPSDRVVLLTVVERQEMARLGYLLEPAARGLLQALSDSGFVLPAGLEGQPVPHFEPVLRRLRFLLRHVGRSLRWSSKADAWLLQLDEAVVLETPVDQQVEIAELLQQINQSLASTADEHRLLIITGEPVWYGRRVVLANRAWASALASTPHLEAGVLEADWVSSDTPALRAGAPRPASASASSPTLPKSELRPIAVPQIRDIVPLRDIHSSDFKCSARESDLPSLVEELARFARVEVDVEPLAEASADRARFQIRVSREGRPAEVEMDAHKYPNVQPILDYLNLALAERDETSRLYRFAGPRYEGGVLRATPPQAETLRDLGYLIEAPGPQSV